MIEALIAGERHPGVLTDPVINRPSADLGLLMQAYLVSSRLGRAWVEE